MSEHGTPEPRTDALEITVRDIALPKIDWVDFGAPDARAWLRAPRADDDKYSRGVLGMRTGSPAYPGAAVLGVEGATRTGIGMVRYLGSGRATRMVLQRRPEVVTAEGRVQAWLLGSGVDASARQSAVTAAMIDALGSGHPVVVDAGALDLLDHATGPVVITPHSGELFTLLSAQDARAQDAQADHARADDARAQDAQGAADSSTAAAHRHLSRQQINADPEFWAAYAANLLGVTVLLKGHTTHVVAPASRRGFRVTAPTTELATAGSGDVLAGILGALVATHHADLVPEPAATNGSSAALANLAATAAVLHGDAGARASRGGPIVALDIAHAIPATIASLRA